MSYRGRNVVVTGGLGFIGSNLAIRLVRENARVTVVDPLVLGCGGNRYNLAPVAGDVEVLECSIAGGAALRQALSRCDVVFNLAGEISHIHSMLFPARDLEINTTSQLQFLETCASAAPGVRVVYAGTRQVYGVPEYLPVDERHPVNPVDFNGVHKYAATQYHLMLSRAGRIDAVVLRLTNVYGPRMALDVPCQGFLSTYFRRALCGQRLDVFGDGRQLRDPLYVDDAVEAFLAAGLAPELAPRAYNVGGPEALTIEEIAAALAAEAGLSPARLREFPEARKAIDIGSYHTDSTLIREQLHWRPVARFAGGAAATLAYYREHRHRYLDPAVPEPACKLRHLPELTDTAAAAQLAPAEA
ncbi:MAG: NAD-dependent epimerase/dehydratase family protein [Bryobacterales bacterium]|nr:NAD-dependent epimerase/dehydratase family protein [Bryobacterales bacterium]